VHQWISRLKGKNGKCLGKRAERRNGRTAEKAKEAQEAQEAKEAQGMKWNALIAPGFSQGLKFGVIRL
jgi:hypothetical protein